MTEIPYADLANEHPPDPSYWSREFEAPALAAFNERLRAFYGHTKSQTGSRGDNRHLKGRHRSRNWDLNSKYCTNRAYATTDSRDKAGDGDWLRATDVGITGPILIAAASRLDAAVRAGRLPIIAEWFGTVDGVNVVGWFEGHSSTSDSSHLYHLHVGYWTVSCDDAAQFELLGNIITGEEDPFMALTDKDQQALIWRVHAIIGNLATVAGGPTKGEANELHNELARIRALAEAGTGSADTAAILAGVEEQLAALQIEMRDAIADLGEGGASQVREDAP